MSDDRDPQLVWNDAGEPRSGRYGDVYFSAQDGLAESRAVFLEGCGLPEAWAGRAQFTVAELGFGSGLNIVALLDLWRRTRPHGGRLHVFSIEGYPLSQDEARRALHAWPDIAETARALVYAWPPTMPGFHRIDLPHLHAVIDVAVGEVESALSQWSGQADAWFLDGFSPSVNPAMWSEPVLDLIAARSAPDARLATFTVAGAVRRGLAERGFTVEKRPGHGRKRERLEARRSDRPAAPTRPPSTIVIGGGIAGASVIRALEARGIRPVLVEATGPGAGASGFPAALVTPRFDLGDGEIAALFAQALERAHALYADVADAIVSEGVLQLAGNERDAARFGRIADQALWADGRIRLVDEDAASAMILEPVASFALLMQAAFTVAPATILRAWLGVVTKAPAQAHRIEADGGLWRVLDRDGALIAEAETLVVCAGASASALLPELALSPVRGQADWCVGQSGVAVAWGGYAAPTADGLLFGATHDRGDADLAVRAKDTERNLATLAARLPMLAARIDRDRLMARAAIRATTRDRLPVAGAMPGGPGVFVLGGLGSRGFCLAPLLGEHIASLIARCPSPLPTGLALRLSPARPSLQTLAHSAPEEDA